MNTRRVSLSLLTIILLGTVSTTPAQFVCQRDPNAIVINGSITAGDTGQAGRITRDGVPSTCAGGSSAQEDAIVIRRDSHSFTNPFSETVCVRVEMDFTGCAGNQNMSVAYSSYNPALPASGVIGDSGFSTINRGSYAFRVGPNANFSVVVHEIDPNTGCPFYNLKITYLRNCRQAGFDRTNDGVADPTVYRPSTVSNWYTLDSASNQLVTRTFGTVGDFVTGGSDYTGDGRSDLSVYRPSTNTWYYGLNQDSPGENFSGTTFGAPGDRVTPGDFDGDGINDIALWRPSDGNYYLLRSSNGAFQAFHWGATNDLPVFGDFDGDTVTDFAVVRQTGQGSIWHLQKSNFNLAFDQSIQWGLPTDKLVPADYDGDSITDLAVWRPTEGTFYVRRSSNLSFQAFQWGTQGDLPQPADYDGDRKADFAVFRPSQGHWYIYYSATATFRAVGLGQQGDQPITSAYRIQ